MKNVFQNIKITQIATLLIVFHLPLTAWMPMQIAAHFIEHRTEANHALAHSMLSCRLACSVFVFMTSLETGFLQGLNPLPEERPLPDEKLYEKVALSEPSIRGPPVETSFSF